MTAKVTGKEVFKPHVHTTVSMMRRFGVGAEREGSIYHNAVEVCFCGLPHPADFSFSVFLLVAGGISGRITACSMDIVDAQEDSRVIDVLKKAGYEVTVKGDEITCVRV